MSDHLAGFNAAISNWIGTTNTLADVIIVTQRDRDQQRFQAEQAELDRNFARERDQSQRDFTRERDTTAFDRGEARDEKQFDRTIKRDEMQQRFSLDRIERDQERSFQVQDKIEDRLFRRDEKQAQRAQVRDLMQAQMARQNAVVATFTPDAQLEYDRLNTEIMTAMQADPGPERDRYLGVLNQQVDDLMRTNIEKGYVMRMTSADRAAYYNLQEQIDNPPSTLMPHEVPAYQEQLEAQKKKVLQKAILNENAMQMDFDQRVVTTPYGLKGLMLGNGSIQILNDPQEQMIDSAIKDAIQFYQGMDVSDDVIMGMAEKTVQMKQRMMRRLRGEQDSTKPPVDPKKVEYEGLLKTQQMIQSAIERFESTQKVSPK